MVRFLLLDFLRDLKMAMKIFIQLLIAVHVLVRVESSVTKTSNSKASGVDISEIINFSDNLTKEAKAEEKSLDIDSVISSHRQRRIEAENKKLEEKRKKLLELKKQQDRDAAIELAEHEIVPQMKHENEVKIKPRRILSRFDTPKRIAKTTLLNKAIHSITSESEVITRIKDIVSFEGIRDNQLIGYGIVVGLDGTGDKLQNSPFTKESLIVMLERLGVNVRDLKDKVNITNVAAVMVTANLPPFARNGNKIDVNIATIGTATSLMGGTLLPTPLKGANGEVYAVAQGEITSSGFVAASANAKTTKGVPTSGKIVRGAIVENEIDFELKKIEKINLSLHNPDFTTAKRVAEIINKNLSKKYNAETLAEAKDSSTVELKIPTIEVVKFLTDVEQLTITPDNSAKVIFDDKEGVIVITENVKISPVVVTQGALTVTVTHYNDYNNYSDDELKNNLVNQERLLTQGSPIGGNNVIHNNFYNNPYNNPYYTPKNNPFSYNPFFNQMSSMQGMRDVSYEDAASVINRQNINANTAIGISENGNVNDSNKKYQTALKTNQVALGTDNKNMENLSNEEIDNLEDTSDGTKNANRYSEYHHEKFNMMNGATLQDLMNTMNAIGASPRDMIAILQVLKRSGAIQATLESM